MTITPFAAGSYNTTLNTQRLLATKGRLDTLTTQLSTGRVAETYGGLGASRTTSLTAHAQVARLDGYAASITGALNRIGLGSASVQNLSKVTSTTVSSIATGLTNTSSSSARNTTRSTAAANLDLFVDTLNQNYAGTYLFGGRATDTPPVASVDAILNGVGGKAGLTTVIAERKNADGATGSLGLGNLSIPAPTVTTSSTTPPITTAVVNISEAENAANRLNFGFTLGTITSSNLSAITYDKAAGTKPASTLNFGTPPGQAQPKDGDIVRITVNGIDGKQSIVDYTARMVKTGAANEFVIGATGTLSGQALKSEVEAAYGANSIAAAQSAVDPGVTLTFMGGTAASASLSISTGIPPVNGDTVTVTLGLRDGTTTTLTLTAKTTNDGKDPSVFAIGASPEATARNLQKALADTVKTSAGTTLAASSAVLASQDFFAGSKSAAFAPRRVDTVNGGFISQPDDPNNKSQTVIWYTGDESLADPRGTATVQVSSGQSIGIGAQANETGIRNALTGIAALASESFASTKDPNDATLSDADRTAALNERSRYTALTDRVRSVLTPKQDDQGIAQVATELSLAAAQITDAKAQNGATKAQLQNTLDGTDAISTEEVAANLLAVQNQLQASYQVTSMLSKLTLVNYMS